MRSSCLSFAKLPPSSFRVFFSLSLCLSLLTLFILVPASNKNNGNVIVAVNAFETSCSAAFGSVTVTGNDLANSSEDVIVTDVFQGCHLTIRDTLLGRIRISGTLDSGYITIDNISCTSRDQEYCIHFPTAVSKFLEINITNCQRSITDNVSGTGNPSSGDRQLIRFGADTAVERLNVVNNSVTTSQINFTSTGSNLYCAVLYACPGPGPCSFTVTHFVFQNNTIAVGAVTSPKSTGVLATVAAFYSFASSVLVQKTATIINNSVSANSSSFKVFIYSAVVYVRKFLGDSVQGVEYLRMKDLRVYIGDSETFEGSTANTIKAALVYISAGTDQGIQNFPLVEIDGGTVTVQNRSRNSIVAAAVLSEASLANLNGVQTMIVTNVVVNISRAFSSTTTSVGLFSLGYVVGSTSKTALKVSNCQVTVDGDGGSTTASALTVFGVQLRRNDVASSFDEILINDVEVSLKSATRTKMLDVSMFDVASSSSDIRYLNVSGVRLVSENGLQVGSGSVSVALARFQSSVTHPDSLGSVQSQIIIDKCSWYLDTLETQGGFQASALRFASSLTGISSVAVIGSTFVIENPRVNESALNVVLVAVTGTTKNVTRFSVADTNLTVVQDQGTFTGLAPATANQRQVFDAFVGFTNFSDVLSYCLESFQTMRWSNSTLIVHLNATNSLSAAAVVFRNGAQLVNNIEAQGLSIDLILETFSEKIDFTGFNFFEATTERFHRIAFTDSTVNVSFIARSSGTDFSLVEIGAALDDISEQLLLAHNVVNFNLLRQYVVQDTRMQLLGLPGGILRTNELVLESNALNIAATLRPSDPSTPSWTINLEEETGGAGLAGLGAIDSFNPVDANVFVPVLLHISFSTSRINSLLVNNCRLNAADLLGGDLEATVGGSRRRKNIEVIAVLLKGLVDRVSSIVVNNTYVAMNARTNLFWALVLTLTGDVSNTSSRLSLLNTKMVLNGTVTAASSSAQVISGMYFSKNGGAMTLTPKVEVSNINITVAEVLEARAVRIAPLVTNNNFNTSDLAIDQAIFNLKNVTSMTDNITIGVFQTTMASGQNMVFINASATISNIVFQNLTVVSSSGSVLLLLFDPRSRSTNANMYPSISIDGVSGTIDSLVSKSESSLLRFVWTTEVKGLQNVTISNVDELVIEKFGTESTAEASFYGVLLATLDALDDGQGGRNFRFDTVKIRIKEVFSGEVLAVGALLVANAIRSVASIHAQGVEVVIDKLSKLVDPTSGSSLHLVSITAALTDGEDGATIRMKNCLLHVTGDGGNLKSNAAAFVVQERIENFQSTSPSFNEPFLLFDNVSVVAQNHLTLEWQSSAPSLLFFAHILHVVTGSVQDIHYPHADFGALVFSNCHARVVVTRSNSSNATLPGFYATVFSSQGIGSVTTINFTSCSVHSEGQAGASYAFASVWTAGGKVDSINEGGPRTTSPSDARLSGIYAKGNSATAKIACNAAFNVASLGSSILSFSGDVSHVGVISVEDTVQHIEITSVDQRDVKVAQVIFLSAVENVFRGISIALGRVTAVVNTAKQVDIAPLLCFTMSAGGGGASQVMIVLNNTDDPDSLTRPNFGMKISDNKHQVIVGQRPASAASSSSPVQPGSSAAVLDTVVYPRNTTISIGISSNTHEITRVLRPGIRLTSNTLSSSNITSAATIVASLLTRQRIRDLHSLVLTANSFENVTVRSTQDSTFVASAIPFVNVSHAIFARMIENVQKRIDFTNNKIVNATLLSMRGTSSTSSPGSTDPKIVGLMLVTSPEMPLGPGEYFGNAVLDEKLSLTSNVIENVLLLTPFHQSASLGSNGNDEICFIRLWSHFATKKVHLASNTIRNCISNKLHFAIGGSERDHDEVDDDVRHGGSFVNTSFVVLESNTFEGNCRYNTNLTADNEQRNETTNRRVHEALFSVPIEPIFTEDPTQGELQTGPGIFSANITSLTIREPSDEYCASLFAGFVASSPQREHLAGLSSPSNLITNFSQSSRRHFSVMRLLRRNNDSNSDGGPYFGLRHSIPLKANFSFEENVLDCSHVSPSSCSVLRVDKQVEANLLLKLPLVNFDRNTLSGKDGNVLFLDIENSSALSPGECLFSFDSLNRMTQGQIHPLFGYSASSSSSSSFYDLQDSTFEFYCNYFTYDVYKNFGRYLEKSTNATRHLCGAGKHTFSVGSASLSTSRSRTVTPVVSKSTRTESDGSNTRTDALSRTATPPPTMTKHTLTSSPSSSDASSSPSLTNVPTASTSNATHSSSPSHTAENGRSHTASPALPIVPKNSYVKAVPATFTLVSSGLSVATGASVVGPLAIRNGLILGVLGCGQEPEPLDMGTHPTQINLRNGIGPDPASRDDNYGQWRGVILGNFLILLVGACLLFGVPFAIRKTHWCVSATETKTKAQRADHVSRILFKKLLILFGVGWVVLSGPTTTGLAASLFYSRLGNTADNIGLWVLIVVVGPIVAAAPTVAVTAICLKVRSDGIQVVKVDPNDESRHQNLPGVVEKVGSSLSPATTVATTTTTASDDVDDDVSVKKALHCNESSFERQNSTSQPDQRRGCIGAVLAFANFWFSSYKGLEWPMKDPFVKRWGFLFEHSKILHVAYLEQVFGFFLNLAVGLAQGTAVSRLRCQALAVFILVVQLPMFLMVTCLGPMLSRFDQYISVIMYFANIVTAGLVVAEVFRRSEASPNGSGGDDDDRDGNGVLVGPIGNLSMAQALLNLLASFAYLSYFLRMGFRKKMRKEKEESDDDDDEAENNNNTNNNNNKNAGGDDDYDESPEAYNRRKFGGGAWETLMLNVGERKKDVHRWDELLLDRKNPENDDFIDIIADVLALRSDAIDNDFAESLDKEIELQQQQQREQQQQSAAEEIDLSTLLDDNNKTSSTTVVNALMTPPEDNLDPRRRQELQQQRHRHRPSAESAVTTTTTTTTSQQPKKPLDYELDDDADDTHRRQLENSDDDFGGLETDDSRSGIGAARNEELEMRRWELQDMLESFATGAGSFATSNSGYSMTSDPFARAFISISKEEAANL